MMEINVFPTVGVYHKCVMVMFVHLSEYLVYFAIGVDLAVVDRHLRRLLTYQILMSGIQIGCQDL